MPTLTPEILDDPQVDQSANGLPELRIPVPYDTKWQDAKFEDADIRVWKDGQPQPVETLVDVTVREGAGEKQAVLVAEGGSELKERVTKNVRFEDAHVVAEDLVSNNTSLTANVDTPTSATNEVLMQNADTDSQWQSLIPAYPFPADDPRHISGGELRVYDTALFRRAEDFKTSDWNQFFADRYESGEAQRQLGVGNDISWDITTDYTIPQAEITVWFRLDYIGTTHPGITVTFGGDQVFTTGADNDFLNGGQDPTWIQQTAAPNSDFSGTQTLEITVDEAAGDSSNIYVDAVAIVDDRHSRSKVDDTLTNGGKLTWPEIGPDSIQTVTEDTASLNQIVAGRIDSTWDNTANNQQIEASNDQGASYEISATNSQTASGSFSSNSGQIRGRLTQSYYDSGGGDVVYDSAQAVDLWQLYADQDNTPVLVDRSFDDRLLNVLQQIATDKDFLFELQVDRDYNFSFEMTRPGQRTSDRDTDVVSYDVKKSTGDIIEKAVVKGGRQRVRQEDFTSNHGSLVGLAQDDLIEGTEAVYDAGAGTQFERGDDYEMDFLDGQIETLASGAMADSTTYQIDYNYKPQATFTKAGVSSPKTVVRNFTDLQTEQTAEQLAQVLVRKFGDPIYEVTVTVPDTVGWSVIDEVDPSRVPTAGTSLQVVGIQTTPAAVVARFESRGSPDEFVQRIRQRLGRTETRV